jgi:uncharacterized membrane protein
MQVPKWAPVLAAGAIGGAGLAALTPSLTPRTKLDDEILGGGGAVMGLGLAGVGLGALRLAKGPLGAHYGTAQLALAGAMAVGSAAYVATHWGPSLVAVPPKPKYEPAPGAHVVASIDEQKALPAPAGTSAVLRDKLDAKGLRFLDTITPGLPEQPVRVYAGLHVGATPEARVQFAIDRMKELGAFDKSRIIVAQPSGSGFVNQVPIQSAEMLAKGDVATVAMQYNDQPSFSISSLSKVGSAAVEQRMLLQAIHDEIQKLPEGKRPQLFQVGESLGAGTAEKAITDGGFASFDQLGITRALWFGTPGFSHWDAVVPKANAITVEGSDQLAKVQPGDVTSATRVFQFTNHDDPVHKLDWSIGWRKPGWLDDDSAAAQGVNPRQGWIPGITLLQDTLDTYRAIQHLQPGVGVDDLHDYRTQQPRAVDLALGFGARSDAELQAIGARTIELEQQYFATHPGQ